MNTSVTKLTYLGPRQLLCTILKAPMYGDEVEVIPVDDSCDVSTFLEPHGSRLGGLRVRQSIKKWDQAGSTNRLQDLKTPGKESVHDPSDHLCCNHAGLACMASSCNRPLK
jgi:hypothetical protein